jgi:hypothetical protein
MLAGVVDAGLDGRCRQLALGKRMGRNDDGKRQELLRAVDFISS